MTMLDLHPAWGFETKERWLFAASQRDAYLRDNGKDLRAHHHRDHGDVRRFWNNLSKVIGYIPILNVIVGVARMALFAQTASQDSLVIEITKKHFYRGLAEVFLGPALLILDIACTIYDHRKIHSTKVSS